MTPLLDKVEATASLTTQGSPFHTEMKIAGAKKEPKYDARIVVDWASTTRYRIDVRSDHFQQTKSVDGDVIQEDTNGDFYPGWLHSFVVALLNPLEDRSLLQQRGASLSASQGIENGAQKICIDRNDRPGGIRNDMTWSGICVTSDAKLLHVHTFKAWMDYSDQKKFQSKQIARIYTTSTGSYDEIQGKLTELRDLKPIEIAGIHVSNPTPPEKQIEFAFLSAKDGEQRLEQVKPFEWPPIQEGKTEGYMIVHVLTDATGQVRETSKYNSDTPGLEEAGRQAALGYKFKPLLENGVPVEMEMPLVLHFKTTQGTPLPFLKSNEIEQVSKTCKNPITLPKGMGEPSKHYYVKVSVDETGKRTGATFPGGYPDFSYVMQTVESCKFQVYRLNGTPTYYHVELEFVAAPK